MVEGWKEACVTCEKMQELEEVREECVEDKRGLTGSGGMER